MISIAETIANLPGPAYDAMRDPYEYALDLALECRIVPAEHIDAAHEEARSELRPGIKRGPERRAVLRRAIVRWCRAEGAELEEVYSMMAHRYMKLHSIVCPGHPGRIDA
ncbi:hypothetical protein [Kitasatospora sp. GP82]|uniref:hypothetical protein n=1 Tax=Kitasatospora sp. GP82 TaxID=3035089 RepID=UPI002473F569|nr:hypothetical protein [Kitasatospora sp. GP82]MDH6126436.1 hypothetical protein [Kitasatospora sp. GP82]